MSITTAGNRLEVTHAATEAPLVIDDPTEATDETARMDYGQGAADIAEVQSSARPTFTITDAASSWRARWRAARRVSRSTTGPSSW